MFCIKCGAQLPDNSTFCTACGAKQETVATAPVEKKKATDSKSVLAVIGVVALVLIVILGGKVLGGGGYKKALKQEVKYLNERNVNGFELNDIKQPTHKVYQLEYFNKMMEYAGESRSTYLDWHSEEYTWLAGQELYDNWSWWYGDDWKISYKVKKATKIDDAQLKQRQESERNTMNAAKTNAEDFDSFTQSLEASYPGVYSYDEAKEVHKLLQKAYKAYNKVKYTDGYILEVEYTIKGSGGDTSGMMDVTAYKIDGKWVTYGTKIVIE